MRTKLIQDIVYHSQIMKSGREDDWQVIEKIRDTLIFPNKLNYYQFINTIRIEVPEDFLNDADSFKIQLLSKQVSNSKNDNENERAKYKYQSGTWVEGAVYYIPPPTDNYSIILDYEGGIGHIPDIYHGHLFITQWKIVEEITQSILQ